MSRQLCPHHPDVDYKTAWGCPDCIVELRKQNERLKTACHLVLLFHQARWWTADTQMIWHSDMAVLLGKSEQPHEATTRNLCNAIRVALATTTNQQQGQTTI